MLPGRIYRGKDRTYGMDIEFKGKSALVTGAASGIGKGIAIQLAKNGANVWIGDIAEENGAKTLQDLKQNGNTYGFSKTDVSRYEDVAALFADAKKAFGKIDIVVNAAGVFSNKHFLEATPEDIKKHLDINLMGAVYGCQIALSMMIEQGGGGKIVNISSVGGRLGELDFPFYTLGKAGVLNLTQSVAFNAAPYSINVNAVCPGIIRTPMWDVILGTIGGDIPQEEKEKLFDEVLKARTPLGRAQTTEDIAYAVMFLCSPFAENITGQALNVCGGSKMN